MEFRSDILLSKSSLTSLGYPTPHIVMVGIDRCTLT